MNFKVVLASVLVLICTQTLHATSTVKCGRDSAYTVLKSLRIDVNIQEIDRFFKNKDVVSLDEVSTLLGMYGVESKAVSVNPYDIARILPTWKPAILVSPRMSNDPAEVRHFLPIIEIATKGLYVATDYSGAPHLIRFDNLPGGPLDILYIRRGGVSHRLYSIIGWWGTTLLLLMSVGFFAPAILRHRNRGCERMRLRFGVRRELSVTTAGLLVAATGVVLAAVVVQRIRLSAHDVGSNAVDVTLIAEPIVPAFQVTNAHLSFENTTRETVYVDSLASSCECLSVDFPDEMLKLSPGQSCRIPVALKPTKVGTTTQDLLLKLSSPRGNRFNQIAEIKFFGRANAKISPVAPHLGAVPAGASVARVVEFRFSGLEFPAENWQINDESCSSPPIFARILSADTARTSGSIAVKFTTSSNIDLGTAFRKLEFTAEHAEHESTRFFATVFCSFVFPIKIDHTQSQLDSYSPSFVAKPLTEGVMVDDLQFFQNGIELAKDCQSTSSGSFRILLPKNNFSPAKPITMSFGNFTKVLRTPRRSSTSTPPNL